MHIHSLTLHSSDLEAQRDFYVNDLGFQLNQSSAEMLSLQVGHTELRFKKSSAQPFYHYCFLIPANKLEEALEWAHERMEVIKTDEGFIVGTNSLWDAESFYFYDGNGNISEFICHYNLNNESAQSFSADNIISVNEIGCPSNDIEGLNQWLETNVGSQFWTGNTARFGTNGNEHGVFLLVNNQVKETWFPSNRFPESAPFSIRVQTDQKSHSLQYSKGTFALIEKSV